MNVVRSLKSGQHFDYGFKCAVSKLIAYWDLKEQSHHNDNYLNHKWKISIEFPRVGQPRKIVRQRATAALKEDAGKS